MKIEWNRVTWYSALLALILFPIVFYAGFRIGELKALSEGSGSSSVRTSAVK